MSKKILGVIPARIGSTRLPKKPLYEINGKPLIEWVYQNAQSMSLFSELVIATDSEAIFEKARSFGAKVEMTLESHQSGSERVREVALRRQSDVVVNLQGDEPLILESDIEKALSFVLSSQCPMSTLASPLEQNDLDNPNAVKVEIDESNRAVDFKRLGPFNQTKKVMHHVGLYVYGAEFLSQWDELQKSPRETSERLEQLRALDAGVQIGVGEIKNQIIGIDTHEDVERARSLLVEP